MAAEPTRKLVAQRALEPGKNYVIRNMKLRMDAALGTTDAEVYAMYRRPYNPLYWEIETEDLALGFVKNHVWNEIERDRTIITNVSRDNDNPLVSEFTEVVRLNGSPYPPGLSKENIRFVTLEATHLEFYEALPTDVRVPGAAPLAVRVQSTSVEPYTNNSEAYREFIETLKDPINSLTRLSQPKINFMARMFRTLHDYLILHKSGLLPEHIKLVSDLSRLYNYYPRPSDVDPTYFNRDWSEMWDHSISKSPSLEGKIRTMITEKFGYRNDGPVSSEQRQLTATLTIIQAIPPAGGVPARFNMTINPFTTTISEIKKYIQQQQQTKYAIRILYKGNEIANDSITLDRANIPHEGPIQFVYRPLPFGGRKTKHKKMRKSRRKSRKR